MDRSATMLPCAILCGGLATRLRPATERLPKSLIPINNEPFIAHQLRLLHANGLLQIVLCVGFLGEMIQAFVGDGSRFGLSVRYSFDGPQLLGTAGAICNALPLLGDSFFVLYGDSYLPCDYQRIARAFEASGKDGLMTIYRNEGNFDSSNVEAADGRILRYDKRNQTSAMQYIDYGLGVFQTSVFRACQAGEPCDLADIYRTLLRKEQLAAFEVTARFYEIGSAQGIADLSRYLCEDDNMTFSEQFLAEIQQITARLDTSAIEKAASLLSQIRRDGGRLFILGVGGSAANASHAVNDFRKLTALEAYAPTDNVSELTARTNDEGWASVFEKWLQVSRLHNRDCILVLSVGGGNLEKQVSTNLVAALEYARTVGSKIVGIVGRDGGHTAKVADVCILIPTINAEHVTPHSEAFQAVIWHLLVSHPALKAAPTRWESI
jgi:D-sedoheptulose 7-phosphate isomerase